MVSNQQVPTPIACLRIVKELAGPVAQRTPHELISQGCSDWKLTLPGRFVVTEPIESALPTRPIPFDRGSVLYALRTHLQALSATESAKNFRPAPKLKPLPRGRLRRGILAQGECGDNHFLHCASGSSGQPGPALTSCSIEPGEGLVTAPRWPMA